MRRQARLTPKLWLYRSILLLLCLISFAQEPRRYAS